MLSSWTWRRRLFLFLFGPVVVRVEGTHELRLNPKCPELFSHYTLASCVLVCLPSVKSLWNRNLHYFCVARFNLGFVSWALMLMKREWRQRFGLSLVLLCVVFLLGTIRDAVGAPSCITHHCAWGPLRLSVGETDAGAGSTWCFTIFSVKSNA